MSDAEGRSAELEALRPLYDRFDDVHVRAALDQWWLVRVTASSEEQTVSRSAQGRSFLEALRAAAAEVMEAP